VMLPGGNGLPNVNNIQAFVVDPNSHPVDLATDPVSGDLLYANFEGGQIRRIQYLGGNNPPTAVATANPTSGPAPLTVQFNGSGSSDPDGMRSATHGTWTATVPTTTRPRPTPASPTPPPGPTRPGCGSPTPGVPPR
jgi:PKD repeat protein